MWAANKLEQKYFIIERAHLDNLKNLKQAPNNSDNKYYIFVNSDGMSI